MERFKIEKDFMVDEYRCVIVGQYLGHRCGYIGIPKEHPLYGEWYDNIDGSIDVHGGWTYSEHGSETGYPVEGNLYWLGFDCGHCGDGKDIELIKSFAGNKGNDDIIVQLLKMEKMFPDEGVVRTAEYVEDQLRDAVEQLKKIYWSIK